MLQNHGNSRAQLMRHGRLAATAAILLLGASLTTTAGALAAPCTGPGAPTTTQTQCLTAVQIPGNSLRSFGGSWASPFRKEYYLSDPWNAGIDIIDTGNNTFKRRIGGFVGMMKTPDKSGPYGVISFQRWLYAGDGDSTIKVIDLDGRPTDPIEQKISTGGTTRVDEMALSNSGNLLLALNNSEDPPFATLFEANGDKGKHGVAVRSAVRPINKITVSSTILPAGFGLSLGKPAWESATARFYTAIPVIADNPPGCNFGQLAGPITCHGGLLVTDPAAIPDNPGFNPVAVEGAFDPATNTGVLALDACSPNGATLGAEVASDIPIEELPFGKINLLLGCSPENNPVDTQTQIIDARGKSSVNVNGITGSDEVSYNPGDARYYTASNKQIGGAVLGVIDGKTKFLIETIPQSSDSHSVATDCLRDTILVPQVAPSVFGSPGDTTTVGAGICGGNNGCVAVYINQNGPHKGCL